MRLSSCNKHACASLSNGHLWAMRAVCRSRFIEGNGQPNPTQDLRGPAERFVFTAWLKLMAENGGSLMVEQFYERQPVLLQETQGLEVCPPPHTQTLNMLCLRLHRVCRSCRQCHRWYTITSVVSKAPQCPRREYHGSQVPQQASEALLLASGPTWLARLLPASQSEAATQMSLKTS